MNDKEIICHLVEGLKSIVALKDVKGVHDTISIMVGDANDDGWRTIHPREKMAFGKASGMAQKIIDTIPK
jgi:hypothetical protein